MAAVNGVAGHTPSALFKPIIESHKFFDFSPVLLSTPPSYKTNPNPLKLRTKNRRNWVVESITEDKELTPAKIDHSDEAKNPLLPNGSKILEFFSSSNDEMGGGDDDAKKMSSRAINASIVLGFGTLAVSKLLTIDHDYWHGRTLYEVLRYVPEHNWITYEQALKANPVVAKMAISGIVYSIGDWIAQCYEGKPLFDFDRTRLFRSGLVGFTLHGSLSHYYYQFCEAGWKLWPFAHLITYGVITVEQRFLWVDCVELIWVTILSTYSNEKSEARITEDAKSSSSTNPPEE